MKIWLPVILRSSFAIHHCFVISSSVFNLSSSTRRNSQGCVVTSFSSKSLSNHILFLPQQRQNIYPWCVTLLHYDFNLFCYHFQLLSLSSLLSTPITSLPPAMYFDARM